jgi:hypothetical protein
MRWSEVNLAPNQRTLRQFAGIWLVFFGLLACGQFLWGESRTAAVVLAVLACAVGLPGVIYPQTIRLVFVAAMVAAFPIGWVVSRILLAVLFYGLFTPMGLLFRLLRRDALQLQHRPHKESYWEAKPAPAGVHSYLRQF